MGWNPFTSKSLRIDMSQIISAVSILEKIIITGALFMLGAVVVLAVGTIMNPLWFVKGLTVKFPLIIVGVLLMVVGAKIKEIVE